MSVQEVREFLVAELKQHKRAHNESEVEEIRRHIDALDKATRKPKLRTVLGLHTELRSLPLEDRAERLLRAMVEQVGKQHPKSDRCPVCWPMRGFNSDDAVCAYHLSKQFVESREALKLADLEHKRTVERYRRLHAVYAKCGHPSDSIPVLSQWDQRGHSGWKLQAFEGPVVLFLAYDGGPWRVVPDLDKATTEAEALDLIEKSLSNDKYARSAEHDVRGFEPK